MGERELGESCDRLTAVPNTNRNKWIEQKKKRKNEERREKIYLN